MPMNDDQLRNLRNRLWNALQVHHAPDLPAIRAAREAFRRALEAAPEDHDSDDYWQHMARALAEFDAAIAEASRYIHRDAPLPEIDA